MGSNPTPSAREQRSRRRGWAFEPRVEPPVLCILGSPSAPLSRRLGCESHPRGGTTGAVDGRYSNPGLRLRRLRLLTSPSGRFAGPRLRVSPHWMGGLAGSRRRAGTHASGGALFSSVVSQTVDGSRRCMFGRVAEWLKAHDWKSCGLTPTWVRIPPRPLAGAARHRTAWAFEPRVEVAEASPPHLAFGPAGAGPRLANPTPSACGRSSAPDGVGCVNPGLSPPVLCILGSPSGRLAPDLGPRVLLIRRGGHLAGERERAANCVHRRLLAATTFRGVAQSGRALRSGRRGPRFKSGRPDFDSRLRGVRP